MVTKCVNCGGTALKMGAARRSENVGSQTFVAQAPEQRCQNCGETYEDGAAAESFDLSLAAHLARTGPISGETFRRMRKAVALQAKTLAAKLAVAPETVSRWETGERDVDRSAWMLLGSIVLDAQASRSDTLIRLATVLEKKRPETIDLDVGTRPPFLLQLLTLVCDSPHHFDANMAKVLQVPVELITACMERLTMAGLVQHVATVQGMEDWKPTMTGGREALVDAALARGFNLFDSLTNIANEESTKRLAAK